MFEQWFALLLTSCCLCCTRGNNSDPYRINCLYEKFNSSVTSMEGAEGVWHFVRVIAIQNATVDHARNPANAVTANIRRMWDASSQNARYYVDTFFDLKSGTCERVPLFLTKRMRTNGDSFYLYRCAHRNGTTFRATVYPLFLEPGSTSVVWYRHLTIGPARNLIIVLSRFYNEVLHMDRVNETLRAFCPDIGPSVDWCILPPAVRDLVASPNYCLISSGW